MKCYKCGTQSYGKYCCECGARLKDQSQINYRDLQRSYRKFKNENAVTYPLWTVADGCFQAAKAMQRKDMQNKLSTTCTEDDVREIMENTEILFQRALDLGNFKT